ncbi:response regulator transcription factor [Aliidiomarina maris]|uniref:DNA-binding response regulator n=1 Tax=Aliidiomarina maris TaxID=531312 RepID=A0A327WTU6_9GAMM|nr:response regulator transcription factor [Aliidiomarina maris]MCL5051149.1 response regulator transcription factor [Bacillota bacterium]RAJ94904.1 two-component system response regulator CpxR [Aliidiomarina maris]RUO20495.1 DNA-binding response regulator [Aliidiomarina maris]
MTKLLLVEDDKELAELVSEYLRINQFDVTCCTDGRRAIHLLTQQNFDLVLLDIMLPGIDGLEVLRSLRKHAATPVIIISARGGDLDKIVGLELGADDYLEKPFNHRELLARVKALLRRSQLLGGAQHKVDTQHDELAHLVVADLSFNLASRTLLHQDMPVSLTGMEYALLLKLAQNQGEVVSKEQLSIECLGRRLTPFDRSIDTHMSKIRKKIAQLSERVQIRAIRGKGYCLTC